MRKLKNRSNNSYQANEKQTILVGGHISEGKSAVIKYLGEKEPKYTFVELPSFPTYTPEEALDRKKEIHKIVKEVETSIVALLYIENATSIKNYHVEGYHFLVKQLFDNPPPVLLILTRGENYLPSQDYMTRSVRHFEHVNMVFDDHLLTCFAKGGVMEKEYGPLRETSIRMVLTALERILLSRQIGMKNDVAILAEVSTFVFGVTTPEVGWNEKQDQTPKPISNGTVLSHCYKNKK